MARRRIAARFWPRTLHVLVRCSLPDLARRGSASAAGPASDIQTQIIPLSRPRFDASFRRRGYAYIFLGSNRSGMSKGSHHWLYSRRGCFW